MECEVRFFGGISTAAGHTEAVTVNLAGATLGGLLDYIQATWPDTAAFIQGAKSGSVIMILNQTVLTAADRNLPLKSGDKLVFTPFIAGG